MAGINTDPEGADLALPIHKLGLTGSGDVGDLSMMDVPMPAARPQQGFDPITSSTYDLDLLGPVDDYGLTQPETPAGQGRRRMLSGALNRSRADSVVRESAPKRAPTMQLPARTITGKAPSKQQQALNFAKALGFVGEEEASEEYAQAAAKALAKMTKGMSVAKLLSSAQRPKAQAEFQRLLEIEAAKMRQTQPTQPVRGLMSPAT